MTNTPDTLNLLMFDTSDNTTELFARKLVESGMQLHRHRESDKLRLFDAIRSKHWDMLLLGDEVKELDVGECTACVRKYQRQTALVVLTAKPIGAEQLAEAHRQGIAALVSLDHPEYSCAVVAREFQALRNLRLSARLQVENSELVERCHALMGSSKEAVAYVHDGMHVHANASYLQKFNFPDLDEALSTPFIDLVHASCRPALKEAFKTLQKGSRSDGGVRKSILDMVAIGSTGEEFSAQFVLSTSQYNGEEVLQILVSTESAEQASLKQAVDADAETGLYNRQFFMKKADEFIQQSQSGRVSGGMLLYAVVNRFESMRTDMGWDAADNAMLQLAAFLKQHCGANDILARLTDQAFAMLICPTAEADAAAAAEALLMQLKQFRFSGVDEQGGPLPHCTAVSMAINSDAPSLRACLTALMQNVAALQPVAIAPAAVAAPGSAPLADAEVAKLLYVPAVPGTDEYMAGCLSLALSGDQARLFHHPVISVGEIETEFHEIDLHIQGPDEKLLHAREWQQYANHQQLGLRADRWQLQSALTMLATLRQQGLVPQFMLTLSSATLVDASFEQWLTELAWDKAITPSALILNVSAAQIHQDPVNVSQQLTSLAAAGFRICISQPSSTEEICQLVVMTNASFARFNAVSIRHLMSDKATSAPFSTLVDTLQQAECRVIVAGADDSRIISLLWQQKVDLMQGSYFGHEAMEASAGAFLAAEAVQGA